MFTSSRRNGQRLFQLRLEILEDRTRCQRVLDSELVVNPARPNRIEPLVIKRRMKEYTLMKKPRRKLRKALERKRHAA